MLYYAALTINLFNQATDIMEYTSKEVYEYVSKKSNDPIVEWRKCRLSWQDFPIYQPDLEFYDKISPTFEIDEEYAKEFFGKNSDVKDSFEYKDWKIKAKLPAPTLCPEERCRRRFSFANEMKLYARKCDISGKQIISTFSPDKPYKVYSQEIRFKWDRKEPSYEYNKSNFINTFKYLLKSTPVAGKSVSNCEYTNYTVDSKDSYMSFDSVWLNNCLFVREGVDSENCIDCECITECHNCFSCIKIEKCFWLFYSEKCLNCSNSSYLYNCIWCHDCYNCVNLKNKSYCINNKQYSKEEYQDVLKNFKFEELLNQIFIGCKQDNCENCYWNNLSNWKDNFFVAELTNCKNVKYTRDDIWMEDVYDWMGSYSRACIEMFFWFKSYQCGFCLESRINENARYCFSCYNSKNIFWCIWLQNKSYCIYNKQYSKEEYNRIVPEIIAQMIRDKQRWEFFDSQLSYFGYNESFSMSYYPLTKEEALKMWYKWSDYESPFPHVEKTVQWKVLPTQGCRIIKEKKPEILEKILNYAIICEVSKKPFRVTKQEIEFYVKYDIPLPTKHPDIRHQERFYKKDPVIMKLINCDQCWEEMLSVNEKWWGRKVLCESCFNNEL